MPRKESSFYSHCNKYISKDDVGGAPSLSDALSNLSEKHHLAEICHNTHRILTLPTHQASRAGIPVLCVMSYATETIHIGTYHTMSVPFAIYRISWHVVDDRNVPALRQCIR